MKKQVSLLLVAVLFLLPLCACTGQGSEVASSGMLPLRVTAVLPHDDSSYWTGVANGVRAGGEDFGVDVKISLPQLNYNVSQMTELVRAATAARVDGIIVQGIEDDEYIAALHAAEAEGIQVVFVDTDLPEYGERLYIGTDNYTAGVIVGEEIVASAPDGARMAVISGAPEYPNLELRLQGMQDAIADHDNIEVVAVYYNHYESIATIESYWDIVDSDLDIDTIVCIEGTGGGALSTFLGEPDPRLRIIAFDYGFETAAGLQNGVVDAVMIQENGRMGYLCVEEIFRFARQGAYSAEIIYTSVVPITAADLDEEGGYAQDY